MKKLLALITGLTLAVSVTAQLSPSATTLKLSLTPEQTQRVIESIAASGALGKEPLPEGFYISSITANIQPPGTNAFGATSGLITLRVVPVTVKTNAP